MTMKNEATARYYLTAHPDDLDPVKYAPDSSCQLIEVALLLQRCGVEFVINEATV